MDRNRYAIIWEALRSGLGLYFLYQQDDWFGAGNTLSSVQYFLGTYFILSIVATGWFVMKHRREDSMSVATN
jgi:hypothetical protein